MKFNATRSSSTAVAQRRTVLKAAAATAAAAAACVQLKAAATGPYGKLHSSAQVLLLEDGELWDTIAVNWCKPGKEKIQEIVDTWEGRDLTACVYRLSLPVLYAKKNYVAHMRRSVVGAARAHAARHPELFADPEADGKDASSPEREASPERPPAPEPNGRAQRSPLGQPVPAEAAAEAARRSPRSPASSRSVAAMAMAALNLLPVIGSGAGHAAGRLPSAPAQRRASPAGSASPPVAREAARFRHAPVAVNLRDAGGSELSDSDRSDDAHESGDSDSDSSWMPGRGDPLAASPSRGGRLRREDQDHQLGRAGVSRPFAKGFVANARFAAGGRSMFQLYKEVTASFTGESSRRECLALARILDALLRGDTSSALEHTCRRLGGVHTAAETGNWAMCERLESEAEQRSFVPDAFMRSALKSVTQMQAVKKSAADGAAAKGAWSKAAPASGRGERRSSARPNKRDSYKDKDTPKDAGAGTSHKKSRGGSDSK